MAQVLRLPKYQESKCRECRFWCPNLMNKRVSAPSFVTSIALSPFISVSASASKISKGDAWKMFPKKWSRCAGGSFRRIYGSLGNKRKAIYLGRFSKGSGYSKADLVHQMESRIILYGQLYTNYQFAISEVNTYVLEKKNSILSKGNEVIIPASGETAEDIARASSIKKRGIILGGRFEYYRTNTFGKFWILALSISNGYPSQNISSKAQGKSVVHIHNSDIQDVPIAYPVTWRAKQDCWILSSPRSPCHPSSA